MPQNRETTGSDSCGLVNGSVCVPNGPTLGSMLVYVPGGKKCSDKVCNRTRPPRRTRAEELAAAHSICGSTGSYLFLRTRLPALLHCYQNHPPVGIRITVASTPDAKL